MTDANPDRVGRVEQGSFDQTTQNPSLHRAGARTKSTKCPCLAMTTGVVDDKLQQLGIILPDVAPAGNYVLYRRSADTLYMSGHLPKAPDGTLTTGKVGEDVDIEQAAAAARVVAINLITTMKAAAGDLDKIRLVKITGFVRSTDGFAGQSQVLNGASDLFLEAFGREKGEHARSAVGVNALPLGVCVEIEAIAEVGP
eukprot:jgi/Undpi1/6059/HiC_scaffold_20.g08544.m1